MSQRAHYEARNAWLATEAAALTTLHVSQVIDGFTAELTSYEPHDVEELNGLTYPEATTRGYPPSLLTMNAVGMSLALQLGENTILETMLTNTQTERFNRFTYMREPQEVQKEYFGTYFSFATRLVRGYIEQFVGGGSSVLVLEDLAEILQTDFIGTMISDSLATANLFWGIAPMESLTDMEEKEGELLDKLGLDSLYETTSDIEGRWPVITYKPEVLEAARRFLAGNNLDSDSQRSAGCPMRFHKIHLGDNLQDTNYLSQAQIEAITEGKEAVGKIEVGILTLTRRPINELTQLFADSLRKTTSPQFYGSPAGS